MIRELFAVDRCDGCSAQAYIIAHREGLGELLFCAHHGTQHLDALVMGGWTIDNQSHKLNEKPSVSASV